MLPLLWQLPADSFSVCLLNVLIEPLKLFQLWLALLSDFAVRQRRVIRSLFGNYYAVFPILMLTVDATYMDTVLCRKLLKVRHTHLGSFVLFYVTANSLQPSSIRGWLGLGDPPTPVYSSASKVAVSVAKVRDHLPSNL